jgi:hypothetical protein
MKTLLNEQNIQLTVTEQEHLEDLKKIRKNITAL